MEIFEKDIIKLMHSRDREVISLLYDRYGDALYGVVSRIVKVEEAAKDVMQDSFIKVWKNIEKYDPDKATLFTWLLRIFRNTAIDHLRKSKRFKLMNIENEIDFVDKNNKVEMNPNVLDISFHLAGLDEKFRKVIEKVYMQGMTQCETSEALDIPLGTVKSRLRLGIYQLRKIYLPLLILLIINPS